MTLGRLTIFQERSGSSVVDNMSDYQSRSHDRSSASPVFGKGLYTQILSPHDLIVGKGARCVFRSMHIFYIAGYTTRTAVR